MVESLIPHLSNRDKEAIGSLCATLTHFDPAKLLPLELMLSVLSYLDPHDLLTASAVSRAWRDRAQDEKLWRGCFAREGWVMDLRLMKEFEELARSKGRMVALAMEGRCGGSEVERRGSRKRKTEEAFSDGEAPASVSTSGATSGTMHAINTSQSSSDGMEGVETPTHSDSRRPSTDSAISTHSTLLPPSTSDLKPFPTMWRPNSLDANDPKLSWPWLYKQRYQLEKNWDNNKSVRFTLPHHRHPEEGHTECVYTIQHTATHLVSGSRDKTIRIWNLDTCRLIGNPLRGHDASVLCMQFDSRPDHDIIVSGGSDAYVIIWRFSTGEILHRLTRAHDESVLNLRFDDRYIVTCSKDKTIKLWSRGQLHRTDPLIPAFQLPSFENPQHHLNGLDVVREYTLLATLTGHQAAVNAVVIHNHTIISASGDRTIRSWNLHTGRCERSYVGHTKGIACVQFDGRRRIVSGSSDNTVRVFDAETSAEIACLNGHGNLVRTVQARFGDLETVSDSELLAQARAADAGFFSALESGLVPATVSRSRNAARNAGSSRPDQMLAVGGKVPPGGGGSRWAKIVSGSYDETVVLWRRGRDGSWFKQNTMGLEEFFGRSGRVSRAAQAAAAAAGAVLVQAGQGQNQVVGGGPVQPAPGSTAPQGGLQNQLQHMMAHPPMNTGALTAALMSAVGNHVGNHHQAANNHAGAGHTGDGNVHATLTANGTAPAAVAAAAAAQAHPAAAPTTTTTTAAVQAASAPAPAPTPVAPALAHPAQLPPQPAQPAPAAAPAAAPPATGPPRSDSNRVFKLQFDARRIVTCSQNRVIVGWDFAAGDAGLARVGGWSLETA